MITNNTTILESSIYNKKSGIKVQKRMILSQLAIR